jgi:hypothetical protein
MMHHPYLVPIIVSNVFALVFVLLCRKAPNAARWMAGLGL